jgi:hypothetical protein
MVSAADILHLPYTPDLTEGGIAYACRSLPHTYDRMGGSPFERLRRIVAGVAVELAFRRHLSQREIPYDVKGATPFTDPDRYDVSLGGHRCDIKSFLITHRDQIHALHQDPGLLLPAPALVPLDQHAASGHSEDDLYLFAFLTGLVAASPADLEKVLAAGRPVYMIHTFPRSWARPRAWASLGRLALKSEADAALTVELGGQGPEREFVTREVELPPRRRLEIDGGFFALAYAHIRDGQQPVGKPSARLGIHSAASGETHIIEPAGWGNIWVYGMDIFLTGWITRREFRSRAALIPEGARVFQYNRTRTKNLSVPVSGLRPLKQLFERVAAWEAGRPGN